MCIIYSNYVDQGEESGFFKIIIFTVPRTDSDNDDAAPIRIIEVWIIDALQFNLSK